MSGAEGSPATRVQRAKRVAKKAVKPVYVLDDPRRHGKTLAASVAAAVERDVVALGWPVGRILGSEPELLERYGVSRPVLRQAAGILESHQVARMRRGPGGGLVVTAPSESAVATSVSLYLEHLGVPPEQVTLARESIEVMCVQIATDRIDEEGITRLRTVVRDEEADYEGGDESALYELHLAIGELCGNPVLEMFVKILMTLSHHRYRDAASGPLEKSASHAHREHERIVEAIAAGDASLARHRMLRHLRIRDTD